MQKLTFFRFMINICVEIERDMQKLSFIRPTYVENTYIEVLDLFP